MYWQRPLAYTRQNQSLSPFVMDKDRAANFPDFRTEPCGPHDGEQQVHAVFVLERQGSEVIDNSCGPKGLLFVKEFIQPWKLHLSRMGSWGYLGLQVVVGPFMVGVFGQNHLLNES